MFEKRKTISFSYIDALELLKDDENRLKILIEKEVIHQNGNFLELDVRFLDFFETLLEANEEIDTATIAVTSSTEKTALKTFKNFFMSAYSSYSHAVMNTIK